MQWPFSKIRKIKCPDGRERYVFKNLDDVFPLAATDWSARGEATVQALRECRAGLSGSFERYIQGFFAQLDEANRSLQFDFRAIYAAYITAPCEQRQDSWLRQRTREVIEREGEFRKKLLEIIDRVESFRQGALDEQTLKQALADILKPEIEKQMSRAFQEVEKNTSAWMEGAE